MPRGGEQIGMWLRIRPQRIGHELVGNIQSAPFNLAVGDAPHLAAQFPLPPRPIVGLEAQVGSPDVQFEPRPRLAEPPQRHFDSGHGGAGRIRLHEALEPWRHPLGTPGVPARIGRPFDCTQRCERRRHGLPGVPMAGLLARLGERIGQFYQRLQSGEGFLQLRESDRQGGGKVRKHAVCRTIRNRIPNRPRSCTARQFS